jgi:3-isopropylmalate dehydrogenase
VRGVNFNIIRELTGGIYFGERKEDDGDGKAMDTEPYSVEEIERVVRLAGSLAAVEDPPVPVWSLDKANVLATSRLWRKTFERIMKDEYPQLKSGTHLIDSAAMLMIKNPRALNGVVVTSNLFGDIISDEASVIPGSLGLLPSASLGGIPDGKTKLNGIYEPIHGRSIQVLVDGRLLIMCRFGTRYCWQGHRQPHRNRAVDQHDVQVFALPTGACAEDRRSDKDHHRQWRTNSRHRRQVKYQRSR